MFQTHKPLAELSFNTLRRSESFLATGRFSLFPFCISVWRVIFILSTDGLKLQVTPQRLGLGSKN